MIDNRLIEKHVSQSTSETDCQKGVNMTEEEMINCLLSVWDNMTLDKDRKAYSEMLVLLDNMRYFLRHDLQIEYELPPLEVKAGAFTF